MLRAEEAISSEAYQSTSSPSRASASAGASRSAQGIVPNRSCAAAAPATMPGTATAVPPRRLRSSTTLGQGKRSEAVPVPERG